MTEVLLKSRYGMPLEEYSSFMAHRVQDILIVATPYTAFVLEEDGQLTELLFQEYRNLDLNMRYMPRFHRAESASEALEVLDRLRVDLVTLTPRIGPEPLDEVARKIKAQKDVPVAVLAAHAWDLPELESLRESGEIDYVYLWQGDVTVLLAMVKQVEDRLNADHDVTKGGVQVILVVEDDIRFYSVILPFIYKLVTQQTSRVVRESLNLPHRLLRIRARPKILLARTFEEAEVFLNQFGREFLGIISDVSFPRAGKMDPLAGVRFARLVRERFEGLPILLQSSEPGHVREAERLGVAFQDKSAPNLLEDVGRFVLENFGFGDFVFRTPEGREVARASTLRELLARLGEIPDESLLYHARRNHFSSWLKARCEFELAAMLQPLSVEDFSSAEALREHLRQVLVGYLREVQRHIIVDFERDRFDEFVVFSRIGSGSLGGKGRGLAFVNKLLAQRNLGLEGVHVTIPQTVALASDLFEEFLAENRLQDLPGRVEDMTDEEILNEVRTGRIQPSLRRDLAALLQLVAEPLAVRSSSILEDSLYQPFAGVYETIMLPNSHPSLDVRLAQLLEAIKVVYASTYFRQAREYLADTPHRGEEERMAVLIQRLVGAQRGHYFYPSFSGVAASYNYYPFRDIRPEDGVALVAVGLGKTVVEGMDTIRFCPKHPQVLPQLTSTEDMRRNAQRRFYALDLNRADLIPGLEVDANLELLDVTHAIRSGAADWLVSSYVPDDDRMVSGFAKGGSPFVTFVPVLRGHIFPLADLLSRLLDVCSASFGTPVEIEFAVEHTHRSGQDPVFHVLQVRPMASARMAEPVRIEPEAREAALVFSEQSLGHGRLKKLHHVIFVDPDLVDRSMTERVATVVDSMNRRIRDEKGWTVLLGPGRWGTRDRWLGIPVVWSQISTARVIVELEFPDLEVEPSQGSHFFHNLTSFGVAYLHVRKSLPLSRVDLDWFRRQPAVETALGGGVRWIRLEEGLEALVDGKKGLGLVRPVS